MLGTVGTVFYIRCVRYVVWERFDGYLTLGTLCEGMVWGTLCDVGFEGYVVQETVCGIRCMWYVKCSTLFAERCVGNRCVLET